jgi:sugar phosphate isomerase/epimerase
LIVATKEIDEHMPPGLGTINWIDVMIELNNVGYERPVGIEAGPWPGFGSVEGIILGLKWWQSCERLAMEKKLSGKDI